MAGLGEDGLVVTQYRGMPEIGGEEGKRGGRVCLVNRGIGLVRGAELGGLFLQGWARDVQKGDR
jgi:hypothetical protein